MKSSLTDLKEVFESKDTKEWRWPQLKEIAAINPRRPRGLKRPEEVPTTFVPMPSVDGTSGNISDPLERPFGEIKKGYTYFEENDVLFAKITPCMQNGKHVIARNLIDGIGFGTTEFHVIRPEDEVIPEWIHLYIRQPSILNEAATHFTGSVGQQRVPSYFLEDLAMPLPPLSEQKRIAAILNDHMADIARARTAAEAQLEAAEALSAAYLREIFGSDETQKWPNLCLRELCILVNGKAFKPADWSTSGKPIIRIQNLNDSTKPFNYWDGSLEKQVIINPGAVLLAWSGTPGTSFGAHIWNRKDGVLNQHIFRVDFTRPDISPQWFTYSVNQRLDVLIHQAHGGVGLRHVKKSQVEALEIPLPPLSEQKRIVAILNDRMADITRACTAIREKLETINQLPSAILRKAFNGEL